MLPYLTALFYFDGKKALVACVLKATTKQRSVTFFEEKSAHG